MSREIRTDHYVRSADGTIYRVSYVHADSADLCALDSNDRITLPLAELRRVADPRNKRPRVEGVPAERPRCAWCNRPLKPSVQNHYSDEPQIWKRTIVRRTFDGWRSYEDAFDTKDCAVAFAGASWRAGFRRARRT